MSIVGHHATDRGEDDCRQRRRYGDVHGCLAKAHPFEQEVEHRHNDRAASDAEQARGKAGRDTCCGERQQQGCILDKQLHQVTMAFSR